MIAALDPGVERCGLAAGDGGVDIAHQVEVRGDIYAAAVAIVDWLVSVGATSLVIEWGRWFPGKSQTGNMVTQSNWLFQRELLILVCAGCTAAGIATVTVDAIKAIGMPKPPDGAPKRGRSPYVILAQTWRSRIGVVVAKTTSTDPTTGKVTKRRIGSYDGYVRAALDRLLGADVVAALLPSVDRRDAAGALLGYLMGARVPARAAGPGRGAGASSATLSEAQRARRERERLAAPERPPNAAGLRILAALEAAGQPLRSKTLMSRASCTSDDIGDMVRAGRVTRPERGVYVLAGKSTDPPETPPLTNGGTSVECTSRRRR